MAAVAFYLVIMMSWTNVGTTMLFPSFVMMVMRLSVSLFFVIDVMPATARIVL